MTAAASSTPRRRKRWSGQNRAKTLFVSVSIIPLTLYLLFWTLFPMAWAVTLSFFDYKPSNMGSGFLGLGGANPFVGLGNFRALAGDSLEAQNFRTSLANTLVFAFVVLPINLCITIPLAMAIEAINDRLKSAYR